MKSAQALGVILIVILGVFMVTTLNKVTAELTKMNQQVSVLVTTTAQNTLGAYQAVNADGDFQWKFAPVPAAVMSGCGMGGASCPSGAGGACSSSASGGSCSAGAASPAAPAAAGAK
jgi:hypothetical protein